MRRPYAAVAAAVDEDVRITAFVGPLTPGRDRFRDLVRALPGFEPARGV